VTVLSPITGSEGLYRVRVGPISSVAQFDELTSRLHAQGVASPRLAPD
jgi:cell division protein FtsN